MSVLLKREIKQIQEKTQCKKALKLAAMKIDYPEVKEIYIQNIDTHYLRAGGENELNLVGYNGREIHDELYQIDNMSIEYTKEKLE